MTTQSVGSYWDDEEFFAHGPDDSDDRPDDGAAPRGPNDIVMPKRKWKDDEPAPAPIPYVLVSSRDGRGDPGEVANKSAAWRSIARRAVKDGWTVTITYALAWSADRYFLNGNLAKAAHHIHSVALRVVREGMRGFGAWWVESASPEVPAAGWSFEGGRMRGGPPATLNLTQFREALTS